MPKEKIYGMKETIKEVLTKMKMLSPAAEELIYMTGMAESGYKALKGYTKGNPALSFWQIEPATAEDILENFASFRPVIKDRLARLGLVWENRMDSSYLKYNMALAIAMCRLKYWRCSDPLPMPGDIEGMAKYWKKVYNTEEGKGTIKHFIEANK
tara:strand:+ start:5060 stop:5524 length:465 start_codon:yes stop_codon:yes gene_type:complete